MWKIFRKQEILRRYLVSESELEDVTDIHKEEKKTKKRKKNPKKLRFRAVNL